ncbi:hypothetical protein BD311DRAFT_658397 [Dichomitus squalens]|uniref:Uncharacterized protein n=1 Tax=Dichomitus squalens TaxID=114155 RepID=A0A4Q9MSG6_9APHY|nr:hypothetical protein BD311DRAFT_658397 [Dichomitus squalens]
MANLPSDEPQIILNSDTTRPMSIDLSLELERQLEAESLPNSPNPPRPQSLDTNVLANIVTQLRLSLAEITKERDTLAVKVNEAQTREGGMRETLEHVTDKCIRMENELEVVADQLRESKETIVMLRGKVEESRRALMRLQTEKRMSVASNLTLDLSRPPPTQTSLSGPPSSKRASFAPLTGSPAGRGGYNHRRISSVSDSAFLLTGPPNGEPSTWPPPSPMSQYIPEVPESNPTDRPGNNRRMSLLFGRGAATPPEPPSTDTDVVELRTQLRTMQRQLDDTKRDLIESQEAREASEQCVRALRTFISENNVGVASALRTGSPAAAPTTPSHSKQGSTASRWGFRLWTTSDADSPKSATPALTPISMQAPEPGSAVSSHSQAIPRKFGGLFNAKTSIPSNASPRPSYDPLHQEPMFNGSDTSSMADSTGPVSPVSEVPRPSVGKLDGKPITSGGDEVEITSLDHGQDIPVASTA